MENEILEAIKHRDEALLSEFCHKGEYMAEGGKQVIYVCKSIDASEILTFMHRWDAVILEITKKKL